MSPDAIQSADKNLLKTVSASSRADRLSTIVSSIDHVECMKDLLKLVTAFLVLNFSVVALAIAGYQKSGMRLGAMFSLLTR